MRIPHKPTSIGRQFIDLGHEITEAILTTVEAGWHIAVQREEVRSDAGEVTMSECLRDGMRQALRAREIPWAIAVLPGTESRSQAGMTTPDGRTDIPLFIVLAFQEYQEHDPHAIIECKRVAEGDSNLSREYVVHGVDRFRDGKYGENHARGFMLGYVVAGRDTAVVSEINAYFTKSGRVPERLAPAGTARWTSTHPRSGARGPIALYHAMLTLN